MAVFVRNAHSEVGESIPPLTPHAVSVSLPTWSANVGYEEGQEWVLSKMETGYPRFFMNSEITKLSTAIVERFGRIGEIAVLFPSHSVGKRCLRFIVEREPLLDSGKVRLLDIVRVNNCRAAKEKDGFPCLCAVLFPNQYFSIAKQFWQHTGEGISSRRAEFNFKLLENGQLQASTKLDDSQSLKGPRRYQRNPSIDGTRPQETNSVKDVKEEDATTAQDPERFVEERFGRNLHSSSTSNAKLAITRRIAGSIAVGTDDASGDEEYEVRGISRNVSNLRIDDVYLYPTGMSSIFNTHRSLMAAFGKLKSITFGFPYIDTLKILEKFGPGCLFYGFGSREELDDLERRLQGGERFLALFCEFPGNPLLKSPDLRRIRSLADTYGFAVVVDETLGNFRNINVLPYSDVVVSSLTKIFSGDCNVMGGSAILNPQSQHCELLKKIWDSEYEDNVWDEDVVFLERNSRDFVSRIDRINRNAEAICDVLKADSRVKQVNYPKLCSTREFYDQCRTPEGGYGGLLSATFHRTDDATAFFDHLDTAKGPSLGTNFTLSSPYVILAHYGELDWAASFGVEADLVRFSVGLEETSEIVQTFRRALQAIPR